MASDLFLLCLLLRLGGLLLRGLDFLGGEECAGLLPIGLQKFLVCVAIAGIRFDGSFVIGDGLVRIAILVGEVADLDIGFGLLLRGGWRGSRRLGILAGPGAMERRQRGETQKGCSKGNGQFFHGNFTGAGEVTASLMTCF